MAYLPRTNKYTIQITCELLYENGRILEIDFSDLDNIDHEMILDPINPYLPYLIDKFYYSDEFKIIGLDDPITYINIL